ncbi:DUF1963 domain-containing protein [Actinomadura sp. KC345]|uniref:DUF1963 domain-containing protein n=1 Tax=Actinomadura sp. KC345 TaxID=2530371 RepID=UPI0010528CD1|nr:DUF1963 domain-containing protein [Actinomadura sp. KC345]TDC55033.1 DUF1963 domain-containing protein [Actinomadura sp. KC345]
MTTHSDDFAFVDEEARARLAEAAANAPDPEAARRALGLLRPSIELASGEGPACGRTRLGGLPPLPPRTGWPAFGGRPLTLAAQLDCAALSPLLGDEWPLPRDGLLLFFYDDAFGELNPKDVCVLHVPGDAAERPAPPGTPVNPEFPLAAAVTPSLPVSFSHAVSTYLEDLDLIDAMDAVRALTDVLPQVDYRLLGWHDGGADGLAGHRPLLQLETVDGADWGEIVNIAYWIDDDDLAAGRFDRAYPGIEVA